MDKNSYRLKLLYSLLDDANAKSAADEERDTPLN